MCCVNPQKEFTLTCLDEGGDGWNTAHPDDSFMDLVYGFLLIEEATIFRSKEIGDKLEFKFPGN